MQGLRQVRPIDPVSTKVYVDFMNDDTAFAAGTLFPSVLTPGDTVTVYKGDADNSLRAEDFEWARNAEANKVDLKWGSSSYSVVPRALKTFVSQSDVRNFLGGVDLAAFAMRKLADRMKLVREVRTEALIKNSASIQSQAAANAWNAASLDPPKDFQALNAKIIKAVGKKITHVLFPPAVWDSRFATVGANTAGNLMRTQLGYLIEATAMNMDATLAAKWLGATFGIYPYAAKAGGNETTTPAKDGEASGGYVWTDTTVVYAFVIDPAPAQGVTTYGLTLGPEEPSADVPYPSWDPWGTWYRVLHIQNEFEVTANAGGKITSV